MGRMWHKGKTIHAAAAGAVIVLGTAVGVPAAYAEDEPTQPWAEITAPRQIALPSAADGQGAVAPSVSYSFADGGAEFPLPKNAKMVIDASSLDGVATIKANNEQCTASGAVVTCLDNGNLHGPWEPFTLTADSDAKPGASGTITYEVTADGATGDKSSSKVVVGSPQLVVGKLPDRDGLKTGSTVDLPLAVRNTGDLPTERVDIQLTSVPGVEFTSKPKNCRFGSEWDDSARVYCSIDTAIEPGQSAKLSTPLTVKITKAALAPWIDYEVQAVPAGSEENPNGTPGTGSPIAFTTTSGGDFETDGKSSVSLRTDNHADFRAVGGAIDPEAGNGTTGGLKFGLTNDGPAAAYRQDREPILYADITLPEGVTGLTNHIDEEPDQDTTGECLTYVSETETKKFEPGHRRYLCPEASTELPGEGQTYGIGVKIAKDADKNATGTVKLVPGPAGFSTNDPNSANDTAKITFKGAAGGSDGSSTGGDDSADSTGGSGSDSASGAQDGATSGSGGSGDGATSGGSSDDSGSTGGTMALTGAGGIGLMAGGAAAALALGGAAVVVTRRRRATRV
ncbi:COG1361 family protein [Streptomyces milbemycinicus]|uniref:Gram-positive cocci surface proteins LPxTG domain-containing protein n=2 Tax=Streptomyces milbemycinicus TaxID=476552 RepID=A0ABW8LUW1_9ACTN